jgi:uncharacterized membrane protein YecN with MAPEG domain
MARADYLKSPAKIDMGEEENAIRRGTVVAFLVCVVAFASAYLALPALVSFPSGTAERLAFAAKACVFVLAWVLASVLLVSTARRSSPADIGGAAAGPPSPALAVKLAFLQNTLEQALLAIGFFLGLAAVAGGAWLALIPVSVVLFAAGRVLFYIGYPRGARGRALGMALTMMPVVLGYPLVFLLLLAGLF